MRAMSSSTGSISGTLLETRPSTTTLSSGTLASGSKDPGHVGHGVDDVDALGERALGVHAQALAQRAVLRVDERAEVRRVDLDVGAAEPGQLARLRADDVGGVGEQLERIGV